MQEPDDLAAEVEGLRARLSSLETLVSRFLDPEGAIHCTLLSVRDEHGRERIEISASRDNDGRPAIYLKDIDEGIRANLSLTSVQQQGTTIDGAALCLDDTLVLTASSSLAQILMLHGGMKERGSALTAVQISSEPSLLFQKSLSVGHPSSMQYRLPPVENFWQKVSRMLKRLFSRAL